MNFLNKEHEERFNELIKRGKGIYLSDIERIVSMYIMSGNEDLYSKSKELYNFSKGEFIFDLEEDERGNFKVQWKRPLSSSEKKLMLLSFDMFSGNNNVGIDELFSVLDRNNKELALRAIAMRY
ncbi:TPA: DUF6075 family protein [Clostridium perfringens]|nr:DUF6075 family protein [Clostridium perfringens]